MKDALDSDGLPWVVVGGLASIVWGAERVTRDVDVSVDVADTGWGRFHRAVAALGQPIPEDSVRFADRNRFLPVRTPEGIRVDLMVATLPFEAEAIRRAVPWTVEGVEIPLCAPEDLLIYKMVSERARDHEDIVAVLRRRAATLGLHRLDAFASAAAAALAEPAIHERWVAAKRAAGVA